MKDDNQTTPEKPKEEENGLKNTAYETCFGKEYGEHQECANCPIPMSCYQNYNEC